MASSQAKQPLSLKKKPLLPSNEHAIIKGLYYYPNFLTQEEGQILMKEVESSQDWHGVTSNPKSRRVIQYGYIYSYTGEPLRQATPIPATYSHIIKKLEEVPLLKEEKSSFDQLLINEYLSGQGIAAHTDNIKQFGPIIACITLGSGVEIEFTKDGVTQYIYVQPNSLYIMSGDARYVWKHEIRKRKSDEVNVLNIPRKKRISLTLRSVWKDHQIGKSWGNPP